MAKDKNDKGGKIRVLVFELEGSDETLQESLRTVANALGRSLVSNRIASPTANQRTLPKDKPSNEPIGDEVEFDDSEVIEVETSSPKSSSNKQRARVYRTPEIVGDLDFKGKTIPFQNYCEQKNPETDTQKYLLCMSWLKEEAGLESCGADHIYSCFRLMHWTVPKDLTQIFRGGKRMGYYKNATDRGFYTITHIGMNEVQKMGK